MTNEQLVALIRAGENETENMLQFWKQNQGFIGKMAMRYSGYAELEDLKQEGYLGLCEAVSHYEPDKGMQFISYAAFWIKNGMRRYAANCRSIRIPDNVQSEVNEYKKLVSDFRKCYGSEPTDREIRSLLRIDGERLDQIRKAAKMGQIRSLSEPLSSEDGDAELSDTVSDEYDLEMDVAQRLDFQSMSETLWETVDKLPEHEQFIIRQRFENGKTLKETGELMDISINTVRQSEHKAMRTLRLPSRSKKFRSYYEEYLAPAEIHHVGLESFKTTWTSEVEREVMRRYAES